MLRFAMLGRAALNISMPSELAVFVATLAACGRYGTASEVVRTGLRLSQEKQGDLPALGVLDGETKSLPLGR